jgi:CHRD domain
MKRLIVLSAVGVVGVLVAASIAIGKTAAPVLTFKASLDVAQVTPHPKGTKAGESGTFKATLTGTTLKWTLTYKNLTGPAIAAHIHLGARGKNGMALVALCGPCKSPISGSANSVTDDEAALMMKAGAYVNVHTDKNSEGEIRGEITGH